MGRFASETTVPVSKSRAEIESTLIRYGATEFQTGWKQGAAMIGFKVRDLYIRFILPLPSRTDKGITHKQGRYGYLVKRTESQIEQAYQQEERQRWRALLLTVKAKLEAVECQISTLEQEFLAFIVMPNQMTVGEFVIDRALPAIRAGSMPLMLTGPKADDVQDAEVIESRGA